jgi:hypothetical protein
MQHVVDIGLVTLVLLAAIGYAVLALGPKSLRKRILGASAKGGGACGGCDDCGTPKPAQSAAPGGEIRIPIGRIGRRDSGQP